jgi:hypothetical protein
MHSSGGWPRSSWCPGVSRRGIWPAAAAPPLARRSGRVRVIDHSLVDDGGPFLGLGVSYFTALWRCKNDRPRLKSDLAFLSRQGFNYFRMLSMVGWLYLTPYLGSPAILVILGISLPVWQARIHQKRGRAHT